MFLGDLLSGLWGVLCYLGKMILPEKYFYKDISRETVLITGGGSGIGRQLAIRFSSLGCHVVIIDVNKDGLDETTRTIVKSGGSCRSYQCDISKRDFLYSVAEKIKDENGFVSIVVNNAGITGSGKRFLQLNDERIIRTMEVNALAHFWVLKAFLPEMTKRNHGHIITISSIAGLMGSVDLADYCASKFAATGLAESLWVELKTDGYDGINSTVVCPFIVDTGLFKGARIPLMANLSPEYVADRIVRAVLLNQISLVLPSILWSTVIIKYIFPLPLAFKVYQMMKAHTLMDNFTGRTGDKYDSFNNHRNSIESASPCILVNNNSLAKSNNE